jgi:predicted acetyltransferase
MMSVKVLPAEPADRCGYPLLSTYWSEPDRHPFLIRSDGRLAGFALIKRGSEVGGDPGAMDVVEFFVLRGCRRQGVGRAAAFEIFDRFPGRWLVRVLESNASALRFWESAITNYARGNLQVGPSNVDPHRWRVFRFESRARAS